MSREITYDTAADAEVIKGHPEEVSEAVIKSSEPAIDAQLGCHSGSTMKTAAENNQNSEILEKYAEDYPMGPHDKPQSMCPAFGSLRVGLRMRRVATVLSGSACCVYGLTFVSHFYGARRSVGYVPFNSETLVTGKLFEDIRDAVHELADPDHYDAVMGQSRNLEIYLVVRSHLFRPVLARQSSPKSSDYNQTVSYQRNI